MSTLLTLDIGNTELKFGLFVGERLAQHWRIESWREQKDVLPRLMHEALQQASQPYEALAYSSVVPEVEVILLNVLRQTAILQEDHILNVNPRERSGKEPLTLPLDFSRYATGQLGTDRLANACGAASLYPQEALIIVSFGTATTFELVSAEGYYLGGAITPGWQAFTQVLSEKTAQLPLLSFEDKRFEDIALGIDTVSCIEAGTGFGYRGLILELLRLSKAQFEGRNYRVLCTGGLTQTVRAFCGLEDEFFDYHSTLTLVGLSAIYRANALT